MNNQPPAPPENLWRRPLPEQSAHPTYWPAMLALSIMLVLLGPVTLWLISVTGLALGAVSLAGWIGEILR